MIEIRSEVTHEEENNCKQNFLQMVPNALRYLGVDRDTVPEGAKYLVFDHVYCIQPARYRVKGRVFMDSAKNNKVS
jgi:hypothetical protein